MTKYIFVTGGVTSGVGKGIIASSLGRLLKSRGLRVFVQKLNPCLNVNLANASLYKHNEIYVTEDGFETDIDLGHYERFIDENLTEHSVVTMGMINAKILEKENNNEFLGQTIEVTPHITNIVKDYVYNVTIKYKPDIQIIEISGTVGYCECNIFLEAMRQLKLELGYNNAIHIHTTLLPYLKTSHELKIEPTIHSVKSLVSMGINPDFVVLRADHIISDEIKQNVAVSISLPQNKVITLPDVTNIYEVPFILYHQKMDKLICNIFKIENVINLKPWIDLLDNYNATKKEVTIFIVGEGPYISVSEALVHASISQKVKVKIEYINASELTEDNHVFKLIKADGMIIPSSFETKNISGKILAIKYAREKNLPFIGIDLGFELSVIEYGNNVLNLKDASSTRLNKDTINPVINNGDLRIGSKESIIKESLIASNIYKTKTITERHNNRIEFNNEYLTDYETSGMKTSIVSSKSNLVDMIELKNHIYFVATNFHPEFKSRPNKPHPIFYYFIKVITDKKI